MASLYIKDSETAEAVARLAKKRGVTKTQAVRDAVLRAEAELPSLAERLDWISWIHRHRSANPLPKPTGQPADKAFFDEMWGEG